MSHHTWTVSHRLDPGYPLVSDYEYDFSQFGQWDGDSGSYQNVYDQPPTPSVLPHLRRPSPLTPVPVSPPAAPVSTPVSVREESPELQYPVPSPFRALSPLALVGVEEALTNPECAVSTLARLPTPQLLSLGSHTKSLVLGLRLPTLQEFEELPVVPSPVPTARVVSAPPRVPTPDSPINYECVADVSPVVPPPSSNQENVPIPNSLFTPPPCVNLQGEHPHQFVAVITPQGESWRPVPQHIRQSFARVLFPEDLVRRGYVFPCVTPFRIHPPHIYCIVPNSIDPVTHPDFPCLHMCSKAVIDVPSLDLPHGSIRYDFREGLRRAFSPLNNLIRVGYIDSLVMLEIQDFLDRRIVTMYGHLRFSVGGQVFAYQQGYLFEDLARASPSLLAFCFTPRIPADPLRRI